MSKEKVASSRSEVNDVESKMAVQGNRLNAVGVLYVSFSPGNKRRKSQVGWIDAE